MERRYTIVLMPEEEGGYSVMVPALPGCLSQGATVEECVANAHEAIEAWIAVATEDGDEVPVEMAPAVTTSVAVDVPDAVAVG